jgi:hypothetical protein
LGYGLDDDFEIGTELYEPLCTDDLVCGLIECETLDFFLGN